MGRYCSADQLHVALLRWCPRGGTEATLLDFEPRNLRSRPAGHDRASGRGVGLVQAYLPQIGKNPSETLWGKVKDPRQWLAKVTPDRSIA